MSATDEDVANQAATGQPVSSIDRFWLDAARGMAKESVGSIEEAAKQVIAIASLSQTVYFAAVSFGQLKAAWGAFALAEQIAVTAVLVAPLFCWVLSLYFAMRVFKPEQYHTNLDSPDLAKEMYKEVVDHKNRALQSAYGGLVLGFVFLVIAVVAYFLVLLPVK